MALNSVMAVSAEELAQAATVATQTGRSNIYDEIRKRGINLYSVSEVWGVHGRGRDMEFLSGLIERPIFGLTVEERVDLSRTCSPVLGIVTARMNMISSLEWQVEKDSKQEDRIESKLKMLYGIWSDFDDLNDMNHVVTRLRCVMEIRQHLPDVRQDLKNFQNALIRWRKRIHESNDDMSRMIEDWMQTPNAQDDFEDFTKKSVYDAMVHGAWAWYKEPVDGQLENVYPLPGGTVIPLRSKFVSPVVAYIQDITAMEPKIYFQDEITFKSYIPSTALSYGLIPLEALVNKVAETLFFDQLAATRADGTVPPEKLLLFGESNPFGDLTTLPDDLAKTPMQKDEQQRIETIINETRKGAFRVLSGVGTPVEVDLSRADTFQYQQERQRYIREEIGLVYNTSNIEMNLTGSDDTSGRSTSESQERIAREKGIFPLVSMNERSWNRDIIHQRRGWDLYSMKYKSGLSDMEQLKLETDQVKSLTYSINEVRMARGDEPFPDPKFDLPQAGQQGAAPTGDADNPFHVQPAGGVENYAGEIREQLRGVMKELRAMRGRK